MARVSTPFQSLNHQCQSTKGNTKHCHQLGLILSLLTTGCLMQWRWLALLLDKYDEVILVHKNLVIFNCSKPPTLYPFTSQPSTLSFSIFYFSLFPSLLTSSIFLLFHPFPFYHNTGCHRRRLNLALVFLLILCYVYFT